MSGDASSPVTAPSRPVSGGIIVADPWTELRAHTAARIALGRTGSSLPTREVLRFGFAHAEARDAVHVPLDDEALHAALKASGWETLQVRSAAPDRHTYLLRPDLGRKLDEDAAAKLDERAGDGCDVLFVVGDGLSSAAVQRHAVPLLDAVRGRMPKSWRVGPVIVARQARVALGDPLGERLRARLVAMLIGERPGLSSPDSLGVYITFDPKPGRTDADRNCLSNVRPEGLPYDDAAHRLVWLIQESFRLQVSGVALKDRSDLLEIESSGSPSSPASSHPSR
ncbi:ethanolamine ammonia-lyase subunit EutC [Chondromyces crocatus]|uniref:Ethanolamine ammonia-lyase small subunit n=1 Tax=Chondromyces crocatus TaxID=52 RepID=A0A0K1EBX5_CHOCO|nr:ethanolamine ammonia-lyase subunit EutC [Chondromyces crocatus]AKT38359.1 ethanolamine ammonia-lyase small subunit [Chondromyces crocatus]